MKKYQLGMTIGVIGDISTGFTCVPKSVSIIPLEKQNSQMFEVSKISAKSITLKLKKHGNNKKHKKRR